MSKIFVIAGNIAESSVWIATDLKKRHEAGETTLSRSEYVYVSGVNSIRGVSNPRGVFIGSWQQRKDILDVVEELMIRSTHYNTSLGKIHKQLKGSEAMLSIKKAAHQMSDEIDNQVLENLMKAQYDKNILTPRRSYQDDGIFE